MLIGTTNPEQYLQDKSGNRSFWPVHCGETDLKALSMDRDQLWAEAAHREAAGESIQLDSALFSQIRDEQEKRLVVDPLEEQLDVLVEGITGIIPVDQLYAAIGLGEERAASRSRRYALLIEHVMAKHGWAKKRRRLRRHPLREETSDNREWVYEKGTDDACYRYFGERRCFVRENLKAEEEAILEGVLTAIPPTQVCPQQSSSSARNNGRSTHPA